MLEIIVEDDIYLTKNKHIVDTVLYIKFNDMRFPNNTWTDFTFPILEEWKTNLLNVRNACNISFEFFFHDGPFSLKIFKGQNMDLKIDFMNNRREKNTDFTLYCGYYELLSAIYSALKTFAKILYNNNLHTGDFSSVYQQTALSINEIKVILG